MYSLIVRGLFWIHFTFAAVHDWGYHYGVRPDQWKYIYPECDGKRQSPINIRVRKVRIDEKLGQFEFSSLATAKDVYMVLENNGHAVQVGLKGQGLYIWGGGLPNVYVVEQFHFHWGSENSRGSEHEINGTHFPIEMHVVAHQEKFENVDKALSAENGVAVLGFLFKITDNDNKKFKEIVKNLQHIRDKHDHVQLKYFSLTSLFPDTTCFYRYYGSLTTPPCYESVVWTIFHDLIPISEKQLNEFRMLGQFFFWQTSDLVNNYRLPQTLNGRIVYSNCKPGGVRTKSRTGKRKAKRKRDKSSRNLMLDLLTKSIKLFSKTI